LDGRAYFRSATILFPSSWKGDCGEVVQPANGEMATRADVRITPPHLLFSDALWTQQSQGCGKPGDFISLAYTRLINPAQQPGELGEQHEKNDRFCSNQLQIYSLRAAPRVSLSWSRIGGGLDAFRSFLLSVRASIDQRRGT
jgi:hypothetical protein